MTKKEMHEEITRLRAEVDRYKIIVEQLKKLVSLLRF